MDVSQQTITQQLIDSLTLEQCDDYIFKGKAYALFGARTYGGLILAQALQAAAATTDRPAHSMHGLFVRAGNAYQDILYKVTVLSNGQSFHRRYVEAIQQGCIIFTASVSFAVPEQGLDYQPEVPQYLSPDSLISEQQLRQNILPQIPQHLHADFMQHFPIDIRPLDFINPIQPQPAPTQYAEYLKTLTTLPKNHDLPSMHQAIVAFYSDYSLMNSALRPHAITYLSPNVQTASLNHSLYFHQVCRADEWMLFQTDATITAQSRGLNLGQMWQHGNLVCSVLQENLMRIHDVQA